jgi:hypothetical protein
MVVPAAQSFLRQSLADAPSGPGYIFGNFVSCDDHIASSLVGLDVRQYRFRNVEKLGSGFAPSSRPRRRR